MNAFVTGGSRGIGRSIVLKFVENGWGCAFTYVSNPEAAEETIRLAKEKNPQANVKAYVLDIKDADQVEKVVDAAIDDFEDIHALVNNAALLKNNAAALMSNEEWKDVIDTDLSGAFYVTRSFLMHFISNRDGRIVNISSVAQEGSSGQINYAASKAGLIGITRTIAKEYGAKGIRSNAVTLGYVLTDMTKNQMADQLKEFWTKHCPLRRACEPEEVANVVYFLCSDQSSFITGEFIRVTGGLDLSV